MNNQIRKLAEQAGMEPDVLDESEGTIWWIGNQDLTEFAQLIVEECVKTIHRVGILEDIELESDMIADSVLEHLGVES